MARKPRIEYPGAFYHVIARGNRKEPIFLNDEDRQHLLDRLKGYKNRYSFILYAYVLMDNHIHLLMETREIPLSKVMQGVLQSYTQWYNKKYQTVGHLFQGRYKAMLCDKNTYLLSLVRYIHINCVRAGLVKDPSKYKWSSHRVYLGLDRSDLVDVDFVLSQFAKNRRRAVKLYREFVMEWIDMGRIDSFYQVVDQRILGEDDFVIKVKKRVGEELRREEYIHKNKTLSDIAKVVKGMTGMSLEDLRSSRRGEEVVKARGLFIRLSSLYTRTERKEIAEFLEREPGSLIHIERNITTDEFERYIKKIEW